MDLRSTVKRHEYLDFVSLTTTTHLTRVVKRSQMVFRCWRKRCALAKCAHERRTDKCRPSVERPLEGTSTDAALHYVWASHGWSLKTLKTCWTCLFSLSLVAVRRFVSPHVEEACERSCKQCSFEGHFCEVWKLSSCETLARGWLPRILMHAHQAIRLRV